MIRAVLFDLGDTLINFNQADVTQAFLAGARDSYDYLQSLGLTLPAFKRYYKCQRWSIRWAYAISQLTGREFNSRDLLAGTTRKLGLNLSREHLDELSWQWYRPLADQSQVEPSAHQLLQQLQQSDLKLAVVSNTFVPGKTLDRHLEREDLLQFFPIRIYSCEVGVRKPRKKIFRIALTQLQVLPYESVFVGDTYKTDIRGARRASMYTVLKSAKPSETKPGSRHIQIERLSQLPEAIGHLSS